MHTPENSHGDGESHSLGSSRFRFLSHVQHLVILELIVVILNNNRRGLINAFGVFQEYYSSFETPLSTPASISWIGSLQILLLLLFGSATGTYVDRGLAQRMTTMGCIIVTLATLLSSFSGEFTSQHRPIYYQILLSQGVLCGLGMGLLLVPSTAIIPTYFTENRSLAVGLANSGASIGGIVYPILTRRLLMDIGFNWAMRATTFLVFITISLGGLLLRQRQELTQNPARRTLYNFHCLKEPRFALFVGGIFLAFAGSFVPYFYLAMWVRETKFPLPGQNPYYLLSILNAGGLLGRIIPSYLADRYGPALMQSLAAIVCGALAAGWTYIESSVSGLITWTILYGFFSGSVISLIPSTAATLTQDISRLGGRLGVVFAANAIASLIGNPIAGVILKSSDAGWRGVAFYCAALNLAGGSLLVACWRRKRAEG